MIYRLLKQLPDFTGHKSCVPSDWQMYNATDGWLLRETKEFTQAQAH